MKSSDERHYEETVGYLSEIISLAQADAAAYNQDICEHRHSFTSTKTACADSLSRLNH
jgi:hypothetical protein